MPRSSGRSDPELVKCRSVTLDQITEIDRELLADRYGAAVMKEFREVATWWFQMHLDELIAKSRAHGRVSMNGSNFFLKTDEIVIEYDYEFELLSRIRREGAKALTANNGKFLTEHSSEIAVLDLEEILAAMVKHRYGKQSLVDGICVDVWP
jgi:hypothetical protein